ncbi:MAG: ABC transporter ATP-binding protein [Kiritimatiellae bacterium]|nr:ABC transporter ATP-binding protein [Kiritimatiellia bacterium]
METATTIRPNEAPLLEGVALHKTYRLPHKSVEVLRGAALMVRQRERVAIVGRSGAGKSTLLHVIGGLDRPGAGRVLLAGQDIYAMPPARRTALRARLVGFVFQAYHLLPEMDVTENVLLPAMALGGAKRAELRRRALRLLEQVGLSDRATHMPLELSGGEQQRVAIARALMNAPQLVLADEPTGNLDRDTGAHTLDLLFGLVQECGHALAIVTHDPQVAARCDRVLTLDAGLLG